MQQKFINAVAAISFKQFLIGLLCLNLTQAIVTPISADEAYYALYAQKLSWGYFDHPPLIAIYVWLGQKIFGVFGANYSSIAIRFSAVLSFVVSLYILWLCIADSTKKNIFILASSSFILLQAFGFVSTPDSPLLLATSLFLFCYKKFIQSKSLSNSILLACCMALMMYSKYQGALFLMLIFAGNISLLKHLNTWLAVLISIVLFTPHLYWQWQHNFPSLNYHLVDRNSSFEWLYVFEYLLSFGLCYFLVFIPSSPKALLERQDAFSNSMRYVIIGFPIFFMFMVIRGHVQAHWLLPIVPAYLIFICNSKVNINLQHLSKLAIASVLVTIVIRIALALPISIKGTGLERKAQLYNLVKAKANNKSVVMCYGYQMAALYTFYTEDTNVYSPSCFNGRASQYQINSSDEYLHGREVYVVFSDSIKSDDTLIQNYLLGKAIVYGRNLPYVSYATITASKTSVTKTELKLTIHNPYKHILSIGHGTAIEIKACINNKQGQTIEHVTFPLSKIEIAPGSSQEIYVQIPNKVTSNANAVQAVLYCCVHCSINGPALCKSISLIH
jgi:hypothetical protein